MITISKELNERHQKSMSAEADLTVFAHELQRKHSLSAAELLQVFTSVLAGYLKGVVKSEYKEKGLIGEDE